MATIEVPALGESITEAIVSKWLKQPGDSIAVDEPVVELETDKITVEVPAPQAGTLTKQLAEEGDTVNVGDAICEIDADGAGDSKAKAEDEADASAEADADAQAEAAEADSDDSDDGDDSDDSGDDDDSDDSGDDDGDDGDRPPAMPAARAEATRSDVDLDQVEGTGRGGRILKEDVQRAAQSDKSQSDKSKSGKSKSDKPSKSGKSQSGKSKPKSAAAVGGVRERRVKMRPLRKTIAARLVEAQQTAAILTTFNEVDMSKVMQMRKTFKQDFIDAHGIKLGFMSFFVKAATSALAAFPAVNAQIEGEEIVYKEYYNVGVAVGGGRGLVVPVIRDADALGFAEIEAEINRLAKLAKDNKLKLSDLSDGTFTISNGGIYGSMLSTPILNAPQSGILGLHNIVERPVAVDGKVEIRPIMYLALSYDHRLVDGREAVQFLVHVKDMIEDPRRLLLDL